MRSNKPYVLAASIAAVTVFAGCSDSDGNGVAGSEGRLGSVDGTAAKGVIFNADVTATEAGSGEVLGTAVTDASGNYDLAIDGHNGAPILLTLTARANGATTMTCDVRPNCGTRPSADGVFAFGDSVPLPDDFTLQALIPDANGLGSTTASITPLTTIAAARAESLASGAEITSAIAASALSEISNLFGGVNVLRTPVVDITNPAAIAAASATTRVNNVLQAAIGQLALARNESFLATINRLVEELRDGVIPADMATAESFSLQDIIDAANNQLAAAEEDDVSGALSVMQSAVDNAENGLVDPQPSDRAGESRIEQARTLVSEIRNIGRQLLAAEEPATVFFDELATAYTLSEGAGIIVGEDLALLFDRVEAELEANPNQTQFDFNVDSTDSSNMPVSTRVVLSIGGDTVTGTAVGVVGDTRVDLDVSFPGMTAESDRLQAEFTGTVASVDSSADDALSLSIDRARLEANGNNLTTDENNPQSYVNGSAELQLTINQVNSPISFTGGFTLAGERCSSCTGMQNAENVIGIYNPSEASLNGTLTGENGSTEINFSARLLNADRFDPELDISDSNFPDAVASLVTEVSFGSGDTLDYGLNISARLTDYFGNENDSNNAPIGDASAVFSRPGLTTRFEASNSGNPRRDVLLEVSNQDGTRLRIVPNTRGGSVIGTLEADGRTVATVSELNNGLVVIRYGDGSFETLQ